MEQIRKGASEEADELLSEIRRGYPISCLRELIGSEQESAVNAAAWIISELGERAAPLMSDVARLLRYPSRVARSFALDAVLVAASPVHGSIIMEAMTCIDDPDTAVRSQALQFLARSSPEQLRAGLRYATDFRLARLVKWLLDMASSEQADDIVAALGDGDSLTRRFAAAAAARIADRTLGPLERAACSEDDDVRSFAKETLDGSL